jgi:hypothetical protein
MVIFVDRISVQSEQDETNQPDYSADHQGPSQSNVISQKSSNEGRGNRGKVLHTLCQGNKGGAVLDWDGFHQLVKKNQVQAS